MGAEGTLMTAGYWEADDTPHFKLFKSENFRSNIDNLSREVKNNEFVNKIINFINSDKKRPISLPENIK